MGHPACLLGSSFVSSSTFSLLLSSSSGGVGRRRCSRRSRPRGAPRWSSYANRSVATVFEVRKAYSRVMAVWQLEDVEATRHARESDSCLRGQRGFFKGGAGA
jgi:hypothetical protein